MATSQVCGENLDIIAFFQFLILHIFPCFTFHEFSQVEHNEGLCTIIPI